MLLVFRICRNCCLTVRAKYVGPWFPCGKSGDICALDTTFPFTVKSASLSFREFQDPNAILHIIGSKLPGSYQPLLVVMAWADSDVPL